jgi:hypothetical protein
MSKQKRTPGLIKRGGIWHVDKKIRARRLCESTGTGDREEAERYLARRIDEIRQAEVYGVRPKRTFRQAATKHLNECRKASLADDAKWLKEFDRSSAICRWTLYTWARSHRSSRQGAPMG